MKKRIFAMLLAVLLVVALTGCGNDDKIVTEDKAMEIVLEELGLSRSDVTDIHTHVVTENNLPCYSIHITTEDAEYSVVIDVATGEVVK